MDSLLTLIDSRITQNERNNMSIKSVPCRVEEILDNGYVKIKVIPTGAEYELLNKSGTSVIAGESVQVYYCGTLNSKSAYIGATTYKDNGSSSYLENLLGDCVLGELFDEPREIAFCGFKCSQAVNVIITLNVTLLGTANGTAHIQFYIDDDLLSYSPILTAKSGEYVPLSLTLPEFINSAGEHEIKVLAYGDGNVISAMFNVYGIGIEASDIYDPTSESDYIYYTENGNTHILYYIGQSTRPYMPESINGNPITTIHATGFDNTNVKNVFIPEGVEEIL